MRDRDSIHEIHRQWLAFERAGRTDSVLDLCSDDVIWLVPGIGALRGRAAVAEWLRHQPPFIIDSLDISGLLLEISGDLAVKTADFQTTLRSTADAESRTVSGTHLWTLRKQSDGSWRVIGVCWSIS